MNFVRDLKISSKFAATYFIILSIQAGVSGVYLYMQASNSTINQAKLVMEQNLTQTRNSIMVKQHVVENIFPIIAEDTNIRNFLEQEYENDFYKIEDYQFNFAPRMDNLLRENAAINAIKLYMPNFMVSQSRNSYYSVNKKINPLLYETMFKAKANTDGWISSHISLDNGVSSNNKVFSYSNQIISVNSFKSVGQLEIEIKENVLFDMLRDPIVSKFGEVFIIDSKKNIVSDNLPKFYMKSINDIGVEDFSLEGNVNKVEKVNKINSIFISIPIKEMGCSVIGIFPVSNFNGDVKQSSSKIIIGLLVSTILLGSLIYITTTLLLKRVKVLVKAMKRVKDGNLDVSVEVNSKDEFGELGSSFNHMTNRIHELVETVYKIQIMEREAELKALEAQINPHFLYNTLATISWVARKDDPMEVVKIANSLAKFYRLVLSKGKTLIPVKDEIDIVSSYLNIQKIRFEDSINVVYEIDQDIYNYNIIKNILQPLVENALTHGIDSKRGTSTIIIKASIELEYLNFKIIDDGIGMTKKTLKEVLSGDFERNQSSGYAIKNLRDRLMAYYGEDHSFDIYSRLGIGTTITINIGKRLEHKFNNEYSYIKR